MKDTVGFLRKLLTQMQHDLAKAEKGNKTAAQRVRTASVTFTKIAKIYRKQSITAEKKAQR